MFGMNQSTYEQLPPDGFIEAAVIERPASSALVQAARLLAGSAAEEQVRVTVLGPEDLTEVTAMLGRCSRATLYKRFHGFTDGVAHASFTIDDRAQDAYGAWSGSTCIGMASLGITEEGLGDIGVLVEDAWQQRGAGSALVAALVERSRQLGLPGLVADVLADNYFLLPLLARIGAINTTFAYSGYRVRVGLGARLLPALCAPASRSGTDHMISYHIIASVSLAQREDLERQARHRSMVEQGRVVRKRTLRDARLRGSHLSPQGLPPTTANAPTPTYPPGAGRLMPAALVLVALVLAALLLVPLVLVD